MGRLFWRKIVKNGLKMGEIWWFLVILGRYLSICKGKDASAMRLLLFLPSWGSAFPGGR